MRSSKRLISGVLSTILCLGGVSAGKHPFLRRDARGDGGSRSLTTGKIIAGFGLLTFSTFAVEAAVENSDKIKDFFGSLMLERTSEMERIPENNEQNVNLDDEMSQVPTKNVGSTKWFSCEYQKEPKFSSVEALVEKNGGVKLTLSDWVCLWQSKVDIDPLGENGDVCKFAIYIKNIKNGESLTKNVKHETVSRILGIEDISMAKSPVSYSKVSYSKRLGYYVEVDFRVNDDAKDLAEIIEPLVAIALQLNLKDDKESVSEIARYLAYKDNGARNANCLADALFHGRYHLGNDGKVDYTW